MEQARWLMQQHFGPVRSFGVDVEEGWIRMIPKDTLIIPFIVALCFTIGHVVHALAKPFRKSRSQPEPLAMAGPSAGRSSCVVAIETRAKEHGGWDIYWYTMAHFIGCMTLLSLSLATLVRLGNKAKDPLKYPEIFMTLTYMYASTCSIIAVAMIRPSNITRVCNGLVLLVAFCVYVYRDIWPYATYTGVLADGPDGWLLWAKLSILFTTAVMIPLFVPTRYVPIDPKDPMPVPNPEQTCSLFSFLTYSYITPIIRLGQQVEHLDAEKLPPLSDSDASKHLVEKAIPHMDPFETKKSRHIFFGLMRILRTEYILMAICMAIACLTEFIPPLCIYNILNYLENGRVSNGNVRPWFWILSLLIGPLLYTASWQLYIYLGTKALAHTEAILTELVFEHSLRIRFTAESKNDESVKQEDQGNAMVADITASPDDESENDNDNSSESTAESQSAATNVSIAKAKVKSTASISTSTSTAAPSEAGSVSAKVKGQAAAGNLIGKINNFVTTDLKNITDAKDFLFLLVNMPVQIVICTVFLYKLLGWSSLVGTGCMVILLPAPGYMAKLVQDLQKKKMAKTDLRIQIVTEAIGVLRMIKLFGWEQNMLQRIQSARDEELASIWLLKVVQSWMGVLNSLIPTISMLATYVTYTLIMKEELIPSVIFSSLTVFGLLRGQLFTVSWQITGVTRAKVSLDRINDFFKEMELLDSFIEEAPLGDPSSPDTDSIGYKDASFVWSLASLDEAMAESSSRNYKLRVHGELLFKKNCINLIVGPTGSGKTSMLMALLGEMHFVPMSTESWFNLPREDGIAYAAQESWVQNDTIRENILFGSPYDEARYKQVLSQCALEKDLELFEAGDNTEVGEKGITLSGGQKARLTLARAIYSPAKIVLLDDVLAALDVHTSITIVNKCLQGELVKDRTIIMVTHNIGLASPIAQFIISIGRDGTIRSQSNDINTTLDLDPALAEQALRNIEEFEIGSRDLTTPAEKKPPTDGKLVLTEEIASGHVNWKSLKLFFSALGGGHSIFFMIVWLSGFIIGDIIYAFQKWFLGYWGTQYETHDSSEVDVSYYCMIYSLIIIAFIVVSRVTYMFYSAGTISAARIINDLLTESVLGSTLRWLDETPTARIITRFTQDIQAIDGTFPDQFYGLVALTLSLLSGLTVVIMFTPVFLLPALCVAGIGYYLGSLYMRVQLSATREKSNARAPVLAHFTAAIAGIVSVRAYGAQTEFKKESMKRIDKYLRINRVTFNLNRWIGARIDVLGGIFSAGLATYLVYGRYIGASNTGFSLNMTAELCSILLYIVRSWNGLEVQANSLERIQSYLDIEHEPKRKESRKPPAAWPASGDLVVENLSARYSQNGPVILHNLSFQIKSGERIGIVGRTGSGKSSLTLALLRLIITDGTVNYDGIDTSSINLEALRSNITIIPQTPELISGTLRRNLDPFDQYDDAELNDALRSAGLFELQEELCETRITLDSTIASAGGNLSVGERQILALARAMIRGSKLLILDEATSAIDHKTDATIQTTLRHKLDPNVTVITVAHRLQTIMDADKIMVLDDGHIAEFNSPKALLEAEGGLFKALVEESADKDMLYVIASAKNT